MPSRPGGASAAQVERRRSPRYPLDLDLEVEWGSARLRGRALDISAEGIKINVPDPLWVGASFLAVLALDPPVEIECVVRRVDPGRAMSVTFTVPREEGRVQVEGLLRTLGKR